MFKFEKVGDKIKGTLIEREQVVVEGKPVMLYSLKDDKGEEFKVWGTKMLDQQMKRVLNGQNLGILFAEEKKTGKPQPMKVLKVYPGPMNPSHTAIPANDDLSFG